MPLAAIGAQHAVQQAGGVPIGKHVVALGVAGAHEEHRNALPRDACRVIIAVFIHAGDAQALLGLRVQRARFADDVRGAVPGVFVGSRVVVPGTEHIQQQEPHEDCRRILQQGAQLQSIATSHAVWRTKRYYAVYHKAARGATCVPATGMAAPIKRPQAAPSPVLGEAEERHRAAIAPGDAVHRYAGKWPTLCAGTAPHLKNRKSHNQNRNILNLFCLENSIIYSHDIYPLWAVFSVRWNDSPLPHPLPGV